MTKKAWSGSISQRHGSEDPDPDSDPPQNVMDPQHWKIYRSYTNEINFVVPLRRKIILKMFPFTNRYEKIAVFKQNRHSYFLKEKLIRLQNNLNK
jgi:hypothetical protein